MKTTTIYLSFFILLAGSLPAAHARAEDENVIYTMNSYEVKGLGAEQRKNYFSDFGKHLLDLKDKNGKKFSAPSIEDLSVSAATPEKWSALVNLIDKLCDDVQASDVNRVTCKKLAQDRVTCYMKAATH